MEQFCSLNLKYHFLNVPVLASNIGPPKDCILVLQKLLLPNEPQREVKVLECIVAYSVQIKEKNIKKEKSTYWLMLVIQSPSLLLKAGVALNLE